MAAKKRRRSPKKRAGSKRKRTSKRKKSGQIPLAILKRRSVKLAALVKKRGG